MAQVELILLTSKQFQQNTSVNGAELTNLLGGYAIAVLPEEQGESFLRTPGVLYAELPTRVYTTVEYGRASSCISSRPSAGSLPENLNGTGVLVGIIDSGIDYTHPDFIKEDGTTRIAALWDQSAEDGNPPEGYFLGTLYSSSQINKALTEEQTENRRQTVPETDLSGHGTHVAGIAAGNTGVAGKAEIIVVKKK